MKNLLVLAMTAAVLGWAAGAPASAQDAAGAAEPAPAADPTTAIGGGLDQALGASGGTFAPADFEPGVTYDCSAGTCWLTKVYPKGGQYISSSWNMNYCEEDPECRDLLNAAKTKQKEREEAAKAEEKKKADALAEAKKKQEEEEKKKRAEEDKLKDEEMLAKANADSQKGCLNCGQTQPTSSKAGDTGEPADAEDGGAGGAGEAGKDDPDLLAGLAVDPTGDDASAPGREDVKVALAPPGAPPPDPLTGKLAKLTFSAYEEKESLRRLQATAQEIAPGRRMSDMDAGGPETSGLLDRVATGLARFWDYNLMSPVQVGPRKHCDAQNSQCLKDRAD